MSHVAKGLVFGLCFCVLLASSAQGQDFAIRLTRPAISGQRYQLSAQAVKTRHVVTKKDGEVVRDQQSRTRVELEAKVRVMRLNAKGRVSQKLLVIDRFVQTEGESRRELLNQGDVLIASNLDGKPTFRLKGGVLTTSITEALELIFGSKNRAVDDDELFGSRKRRKLGETWSVNTEAVARSLKSEGIEVEAAQVSGQIQLARRLTYADVDSLHIAGRMRITGAKFSSGVLPGYKMASSNTTGTFSGIFPINLAQGKLADTKTFQIELVMRGESGIAKGHEISVRLEKKSQSTMTPLGK